MGVVAAIVAVQRHGNFNCKSSVPVAGFGADGLRHVDKETAHINRLLGGALSLLLVVVALLRFLVNHNFFLEANIFTYETVESTEYAKGLRAKREAFQ